MRAGPLAHPPDRNLANSKRMGCCASSDAQRLPSNVCALEQVRFPEDLDESRRITEDIYSATDVAKHDRKDEF